MYLFFSPNRIIIDIYLLSLCKFLEIKMRKLSTTLLLTMLAIAIHAQQTTQPFVGRLANDEYEVYLQIDFQNQDISIPGQEVYGALPGYLGKKRNSFCWPITAVKKTGNGQYTINMINDYGSEDLTATLTLQKDSTYVLRQIDGSTLKVPKNGKWQKLPKSLVFKR